MDQTDIVASDPVLYRKRMIGGTARWNAVEFDFRALTIAEVRALRLFSAEDSDSSIDWAVAFGVTDIRGLTDEAGEPVDIQRSEVEMLGRKLTPLDIEFVRDINKSVRAQLANQIIDMSRLNDGEEIRLDFTYR